jgi:subtilisin family serine protease
VQAPAAWDVTPGTTNVVVAVLDSGVQFSHPDLSGRVLAGYDFVNDDADASDDYGHGTAVAGVIASAGNNGLGGAGVAFGCLMLPVKVCGADGTAPYSAIADGIRYAVDHGARVINISLVGDQASATLQDAVNYAWERNAVIVAAAGNTGGPTPEYPAACQNAVAVSSLALNDARSTFSSYGPHVALAAPGEGIWTTQMRADPRFGEWSGTSFASPIVAGVAALVASANSALCNTQVVSILIQTASDLGPGGKDSFFGAGRVDAARAVFAAPGLGGEISPPVILTQPASTSVTLGSAVEFFVDAAGTAPRVCQWKFNGVAIPGATATTYTKTGVQASDAGDYSVVVSNVLGTATSTTAALTVTPPPPPRIFGLSSAGGGCVSLNWSAISGRTYRVQFKPSLTNANWTPLTPDVTAAGATASFVDQPNGAPQRFYRVVLLP